MTLLLVMALSVCEMYSELGIGVSRKCSPKKIRGPVLGPTGIDTVSKMKHALAAFHVRETHFLEGNVASSIIGFPLQFNEYTCLSCLNTTEDRTVVSNCNVHKGQTFPPGSLLVGISKSTEIFNLVPKGFKTIPASNDQQSITFTGNGDVTFSDNQFAIFLMHGLHTSEGATEVEYMEYSNQDHCKRLVLQANGQQKVTETDNSSWEKTEAPVQTQIIRCQTGTLSLQSFLVALQLYRSFQLEDDFSPAPFNDETQSFTPISERDIYRAAQSFLLVSSMPETGEYYEYTECGVYKWVFLTPFIICICSLVLLGAFSLFMSTNGKTFKVPYSSRAWFKEALRKNEDSFEPRQQLGGFLLQKLFGQYDEMYVVGNRDHDIHVRWFDRSGLHRSSIAERRVVADSDKYFSEQHSDGPQFARLAQSFPENTSNFGDCQLVMRAPSGRSS